MPSLRLPSHCWLLQGCQALLGSTCIMALAAFAGFDVSLIFFCSPCESCGIMKNEQPVWTEPWHTWLTLHTDRCIFLKKQNKKTNGFSISRLLSKRKVSNHGPGMRWCNTTVLQENSFDLYKNLLLAFTQESLILGGHVVCRDPISHSKLVFCFLCGVENCSFIHHAAKLSCTWLHSHKQYKGLQRFLSFLNPCLNSVKSSPVLFCVSYLHCTSIPV